VRRGVVGGESSSDDCTLLVSEEASSTSNDLGVPGTLLSLILCFLIFDFAKRIGLDGGIMVRCRMGKADMIIGEAGLY
jgi:hypothetical protein